MFGGRAHGLRVVAQQHGRIALELLTGGSGRRDDRSPVKPAVAACLRMSGSHVRRPESQSHAHFPAGGVVGRQEEDVIVPQRLRGDIFRHRRGLSGDRFLGTGSRGRNFLRGRTRPSGIGDIPRGSICRHEGICRRAAHGGVQGRRLSDTEKSGLKHGVSGEGEYS